MDIPIFHFDEMGNRMLIAVIAIIHVIVNHPMAVGAYPLITAMEWYGYKKNNQEWDHLAKKVTFISFLITTTVGALTGVGIWLSSALVSPFAIGSLLRVFFWNWLFEWGIFVSEVILILAYYLKWDDWQTGRWKKYHLALGLTLSIFSWVTMAVIVAILGFMMSTGTWTTDKSIFSATMNPLYLPQLAFRTFFSLSTAPLYVWFLTVFLLKKEDPLRTQAVRFSAIWLMIFAPACMLSAWWYWQRVPELSALNLNVAMLTQSFAQWQNIFLILAGGVVTLLILFALGGIVRPKSIPGFALVIPFVLAMWLLGHFERVREFIRKPYVVAGYMYSNGVRVDQVPLFQQEGILANSAYYNIGEITDSNRTEAGKHVFLLTCTRCHTTNGMNGVVGKFEKMFGNGEWTQSQLMTFISNMHMTRAYMPPFPGNQDEKKALAEFLINLQKEKAALSGAQAEGIGETARSQFHNREKPQKVLAVTSHADEKETKGELP